MKRAAEWFLTLHEIPIDRAHELLTTADPVIDPDTEPTIEDIEGPSLYDTALTAEEGLWTRSGWAGRA